MLLSCMVPSKTDLYGTKCKKTQFDMQFCSQFIWKYFRGADYLAWQSVTHYKIRAFMMNFVMCQRAFYWPSIILWSWVLWCLQRIFFGQQQWGSWGDSFPSEILLVVTLLVNHSEEPLILVQRTGTWEKNNNASTLNAKLPNGDVWMTLYYCHI